MTKLCGMSLPNLLDHHSQKVLGQRLLDDLADVGTSRDVPGQEHAGDGRLGFMGSNFMSTGTELIEVGKVGPNAERFNDAVVKMSSSALRSGKLLLEGSSLLRRRHNALREAVVVSQGVVKNLLDLPLMLLELSVEVLSVLRELLVESIGSSSDDIVT